MQTDPSNNVQPERPIALNQEHLSSGKHTFPTLQEIGQSLLDRLESI